MSTLAILEVFSLIFDPKIQIWSSKMEYNDFNQSYTRPQRHFKKIINCPPSKCAQSALPLRNCGEHNLFFSKVENGWKEASLSQEKCLLFGGFFEFFTIF